MTTQQIKYITFDPDTGDIKDCFEITRTGKYIPPFGFPPNSLDLSDDIPLYETVFANRSSFVVINDCIQPKGEPTE